MKGKGKKERDTEDDCPLTFIDFNSANLKDFPRLWGLLNRRDEPNVGIEDLDGLQLEIETILTSVITRKLQLENEMESLVNWQESKAKDKKPTAKLLETTGKRSNQQQQDDRTSKKFKESQQQSSNHLNASSSSSSGKSHAIRSKSKNVKLQEPEYNDLFTVTSQTPPPPRNDLPDKFWNFVEPFCAPVKQEDVQFLEEMLKQVEVDGDLFRIPALGKDGKWSSEGDSWDRRNESRANSSAKKKGLSPYNSASLSEKSMRKTKESRQINEVDRNGYGALTQRLVSCLMEGDLSKEENLDSELESNDKLSNANSVNILKGINLGNTDQLERRLKGVLEEQGLLDPEDSVQMDETVGDEEDEILHELVKCQNELKIVAAKNEATLRHLLEAAKKDLIRQEWDKKLKAADNEVMEAYRKIICAKQKKRTPTKKEKDAAFRALRERESIKKEMEGAR